MTPQVDRELTAALRLSVLRLARRLRYERVDDSLTPSQLAVIGTLGKHGPMTPRALADSERIQPPSLTRILSALEGLGLVYREPHPTDGRQVVITLTDEGQALVKATRRMRDEWLSPRLADLTEREREVLREAAPILQRLAAS